jgi:putative hydrolase of the HAD superfamily
VKKEQALVSIDFWNTLVKGRSNGQKRHHIRIAAIRETGEKHGIELTEDQIVEAFSFVSNVFDEIWFGRQRTLNSPELLKMLLGRLSLEPTSGEIKHLEEVFEQSLLNAPPDPADGVIEAVPKLAEVYPLAVISDTMYTSGRTLRTYLEQLGLLSHFQSFVFSDEAGYSKPNVKAFQKVMETAGAIPERSFHIGDMDQTDVTGARNAGMFAILYTGVSDSSAESNHADAVFEHWHDIVNYLLDKN